MPEEPLESKVKSYIKRMGFGYVLKLRGFRLVPGLITALIERWRPETHTFHMPYGEYTITAEDVVFLLGVSVNGQPIIGQTKDTVAETIELCMRYLLEYAQIPIMR